MDKKMKIHQTEERNDRLPSACLEAVKRTRIIERGDFGPIYEGNIIQEATYLGELRGEVIHKVEITELVVHEKFEVELDKLASLSHPNLFKILGYYHDSQLRKYCVVFDSESQDNRRTLVQMLEDHRKRIQQKFPDLRLLLEPLSWAIKIANAVQYLHSQNVVCGALAAHHAAYTLGLQLIHYGLWKVVQPTSISPILHKWSAPEVLEEKKYSFKSDVWSFAVLLWQIFSWGTEPHAQVGSSEITNSLLQKPLPQPPECPRDVYQLMLNCWKLNPEERPDFTQIVERLSRMEKDWKVSGSPGTRALLVTMPLSLASQSDFKEVGWYGSKSREETEDILQGTPQGTYLVRWSEKQKCYVLSYKDGTKYGHISGLLPLDNLFVVQTNAERVVFDNIVSYLRKMKKNHVITQSIHQLENQPLNNSTTGEHEQLYVTDNAGIYVNANLNNTAQVTPAHNTTSVDPGLYVTRSRQDNWHYAYAKRGSDEVHDTAYLPIGGLRSSNINDPLHTSGGSSSPEHNTYRSLDALLNANASGHGNQPVDPNRDLFYESGGASHSPYNSLDALLNENVNDNGNSTTGHSSDILRASGGVSHSHEETSYRTLDALLNSNSTQASDLQASSGANSDKTYLSLDALLNASSSKDTQ